MKLIDETVTIQLLTLLLCSCSYKTKELKNYQATLIIAAKNTAVAKSRRKKKRIPFSHVDSMLNGFRYKIKPLILEYYNSV